MRFWKPKYSVCTECGVHFEPVTGYEARWGNLCAIHRKPVKERDEKKDAVIAWAAANWERLTKTMEEEAATQRARYEKIMQDNFAQMARLDRSYNSQGLQQGSAGFRHCKANN